MQFYNNLTDVVKKQISDNMSELLVGFGLAGMFTSTVLACRVTPKVYDRINKINAERESNGEESLTSVETLKVSIKDYTPAIISYGLSAACIIGGSVAKDKKNAMLIAAYKFGENAIRDYKQAVIDVVGEDKYNEIEDRVREKHARVNNVCVVSNGDVLFYESISGRYFRSNMNNVNKAINDINYQMISDNYVTVNDLYSNLNMDITKIGDDVGWNINNGKIEIILSSSINEDGEPYVIIDYNNTPINDYDKL